MKLDERLVDLLMRAEDLRAEGVAVSPEELCRDCPELLFDLDRLLQGTGAVEQLLHVQECAQADAATPEAAGGAPPRLPLARVPGYEILGELGRGGMGVVYQARHAALGRVVALKVLRAGAHAGPEALARFRVEAEAAARLSHPNIVQVYEVGESDGLPYCALEYVEGNTLAQRVRRGPLPPREAAGLVGALADAVHLAHSRNVVHRDLKPANVLLAFGATPSDVVPKVTDFGLARRLDVEGRQTQTGAILGTPSYMAPEQTSGQLQAVGPAADVWALGAILYECLTGRPPFEGKNTLDTMEQVRHREPVPPSRLNCAISRDLETVCLQCLRKEPEKRYGSAQELGADLGRYLRGESVAARPVGAAARLAKWARRRPAVAALLALTLVLGPTVVGLTVAARLREQDAQLAKTRLEQDRAKEDAQRKQDEDQRLHRDIETRKVESRIDALGQNLLGPDDAEREALWMLTRDDDAIKRRFFESLLARPVSAARLGRRAEWAVRAAVGFDTGRRDALATVLKDKLAERNDPRVQRACAEVALALQAPDAELARRACRVFVKEMESLAAAVPPGPARVVVREEPLVNDQLRAERDAAAIGVLAAALDPDEAGDICAEAILALTTRPPYAVGDDLDRALGELTERLPAESVLRVVRGLLDRAARAENGAPLRRALEVLIPRLTPAQVVQLNERGIPAFLDVVAQTTTPQPLLAQGQVLAVLARLLTPDQADRMLRLILDRVGQAKPNTPLPLLEARSALTKRLTPEQAARIARQTLDAAARLQDHTATEGRYVAYWLALPDLVERLTPEQATALAEVVFPLTSKMSDEFRPNVFRPVASGLAGRLPPKEAARWAEKLIDRSAAPGSPRLTPADGELVCELTGRLPPKEAADLCGCLADALVDESANADDKTPPHQSLTLLATLASRLDPDRAAQAACIVLAVMDRACKRAASAPRPDPDQPSPIFDEHILLYECANTLGGLAKLLPAEQAADLFAVVIEYLLRDPIAHPVPVDWINVMEKLVGGLTSEQALPIARDFVGELAQRTHSDRRAHVVQALARVAVRLSPAAAASLFPDVVNLLVSLGQPSPEGLGDLSSEELDRLALDGLGETLATLAGQLSPKEAAAQVPPIVSQLRRMGYDARKPEPGNGYAFAVGVRSLLALRGPLPPDVPSFLTGEIIKWMDHTDDERTLTVLPQSLVRLGERLTPEQVDELARPLIGVLDREAVFTKALAGLSGQLTPTRADEAARLLFDRLARTLPPAPPPQPERGVRDHVLQQKWIDHQVRLEQWQALTATLFEGIERLAPRMEEQALLNLLKRPDCVGRLPGPLNAALRKRLGRDFADPWEMAAWVRQHRPDLDLDALPAPPHSEDQP